MKRLTPILLLSLLLLGNIAEAQFAKPLRNNNLTANSEAKYSIGLIGGISATRWYHWGGTNTVYDQPYTMFGQGNPISTTLINNALFGLNVERRLNNHFAIGLEALYANRSTQMSYDLTLADSIGYNSLYHRALDSVSYHELFFQVPLTYYFGEETNSVRPYVFIAPRVTLPLSGGMRWVNSKYIEDAVEGSQLSVVDTASVALSKSNMRSWNIGAVVGLGLQFRIPVGSYYIKAKIDASYHLGLLDTFSPYEQDGIDQVTGQAIDPELIGKRYIGNATAKLTLAFPIKKMPKDACISWGEYD
jgi:hypothetical protein